jgi:phage baseplate assembly protein W
MPPGLLWVSTEQILTTKQGAEFPRRLYGFATDLKEISLTSVLLSRPLLRAASSDLQLQLLIRHP